MCVCVCVCVCVCCVCVCVCVRSDCPASSDSGDEDTTSSKCVVGLLFVVCHHFDKSERPTATSNFTCAI